MLDLARAVRVQLPEDLVAHRAQPDVTRPRQALHHVVPTVAIPDVPPTRGPPALGLRRRPGTSIDVPPAPPAAS